MADYSTAASAAESALDDASEGLIEEYEIRTNGRRVKRGKLPEQVKMLALLEGFTTRRIAGGICRLAKFKNAR